MVPARTDYNPRMAYEALQMTRRPVLISLGAMVHPSLLATRGVFRMSPHACDVGLLRAFVAAAANAVEVTERPAAACFDGGLQAARLEVSLRRVERLRRTNERDCQGGYIAYPLPNCSGFAERCGPREMQFPGPGFSSNLRKAGVS